MPYEMPFSNANRFDKAIERITIACGEIQTSGLPFAVIKDPIMGLMEIQSKLQDIRKEVTVKEKTTRGRRPGDPGTTSEEVLTPDELARLELEASNCLPAVNVQEGASNVTS